jgi:hypothetical protein
MPYCIQIFVGALWSSFMAKFGSLTLLLTKEQSSTPLLLQYSENSRSRIHEIRGSYKPISAILFKINLFLNSNFSFI